MAFISDILLGAGAIGAACYCLVLARRLRGLTQLESGMGAAIAVLSAQVDDLTKALAAARSASDGAVSTLDDRTRRAEAAAARIDLLLASLHDLPEPGQPAPYGAPEPARRQVIRNRGRTRANDAPDSTAGWEGAA
jgi:hypothetical protein